MERTQCNKCVMDKSAPEIEFDSNGVCNFCHQATQSLKEIEEEKKNLLSVLEQIKADGKHSRYDCLIGLSGGVDSSITLHHAVDLGLRPICFTVDNGYNSKLSDENILKMVEKLKVPFYRKTIDLAKFKLLQGAFFKAGLKNVEIPTDHIILATSLEMAKEYGVKWILSGGNAVSESIMPPSWGYNARDLTHIQDVYKSAYGHDLEGLPTCSIWQYNSYRWDDGIRTFYLMDYLNYDVKMAKKFLEKEYGWQDYGDKHEESEFTKWFQNFYLFEKFGIDKRKAHYSSLINAGQMTRDEAMEKLQSNPVYPELGIEEQVMKYTRREHSDFKMDKWYDIIAKEVRENGY